MFVPLLALFLAVTGEPICSFGSVCASGDRSASVTINISLTIESAQKLTWDMTPTELDGAYALATEAQTTGTPDAFNVAERFLVFDNDINPNKNPIQIALADHGVDISVSEQQYLVMKWPDGYRDPTRTELVAIRDALRDTERSETRIARIFKKIGRSV